MRENECWENFVGKIAVRACAVFLTEERDRTPFRSFLILTDHINREKSRSKQPTSWFSQETTFFLGRGSHRVVIFFLAETKGHKIEYHGDPARATFEFVIVLKWHRFKKKQGGALVGTRAGG